MDINSSVGVVEATGCWIRHIDLHTISVQRITRLVSEKREELNSIMTPDNKASPDDVAFYSRARMQLELMIAMIEIKMKSNSKLYSQTEQEIETIYNTMSLDWSKKYSTTFSQLWENQIYEYDELLVALLVILGNTETLH